MTTIEPYFHESEDKRLRQKVKSMPIEERVDYLRRVANRYLAEVQETPMLNEKYVKEHPYTTEEI